MFSEAFKKMNPNLRVPCLEVENNESKEKFFLNESITICEFLEEVHPESPLYPLDDIFKKQKIREFNEVINSNLQPLSGPPSFKQMEAVGVEKEKIAPF